jgi:hypothetical protein
LASHAQAAIFQDQLLYMKTQQFALDMSGLTQLRDQFQRCWQFVKSHAAASRRPSASGQAQGGNPPIKPDQFSAAATKNAIRVEDLKPPPPKHRRTGSTLGASPAGTGSPITPSATLTSPAPTGSPATTAGTAGAPPGKAKGARGRAAASTKKDANNSVAGSSPAAGIPGASPAATLAALRTDLIRDSPSPRGITIPGGTGAAAAATAAANVPMEEPPTLKRKREEEEIEKNPDAFIEKTLQSLDPAVFSFDDFLLPGVVDVSAPPSAPGSTSGLALDFDPAVPPVVHDGSIPPLSFVSNHTGNASTTTPNYTQTTTTTAPEEIDFDFLIDSSAAGFAEPDAPTPDLIGGGGSSGGGEGSTASAQTPATPAADQHTTATPKNAPAALAKSPKKPFETSPLAQGGGANGGVPAHVDGGLEDAFFSTGGLVVEDIDRWLAGGAGQNAPSGAGAHDDDADPHDLKDNVPTFSWEDEAGHDAWNFYPEF